MNGPGRRIDELSPGPAEGMADHTSDLDRRYMGRALELASRGWGRVHPNPLVGAVVVRDGEVVGEGWHAEYGAPHAEVAALAVAGERARGATLYVTLEPCAHHGKTPPCTDAVIEAGIARVVFALADPNDAASGGAERLRRAGIEVVSGIYEDEARVQNAIFIHNVTRARPFLALKFALSLDAKLSRTPGRPTRITGPEANSETHRIRAGYDAIMVGIGTALADDPLLTVRGSIVPRRHPTRVIVDTEARLPTGARLFDDLETAPVVVMTAEDSPAQRRADLERRGARVLTVPRGREGGVDLTRAVERLGEEGIRSIFSEGGARLGSALLREDLADRLYLFYAPTIFGDGAVSAFPGVFGDGPEWRREGFDVFGKDLLMVLGRVSGDPL